MAPRELQAGIAIGDVRGVRAARRCPGAAAAASPSDPRLSKRASWAEPVRAVDISMPGENSGGVRRPQADGPEPAVLAEPEDRIAVFPIGIEQRAADLGRVHADQQHPY